jgi:zinc/manganese transport system substrate-binding protein
MRTRLAAGVAVLGMAMTITACGQDEPAGEPAGSDIRVVTSTNVWGSVASTVGGDQVDVKSIISDPAGDPHSYQMTPKDAADLTGAQLVVFNGGGYDEFVEQALGEGGQGPQAIEAFTLLAEHEEGTEPSEPTGSEPAEPTGSEPSGDEGHSHEGGENEHVWYHLATVGAVADEIAKRLGEIRPESRNTFESNAKSFKDKLDELTSQLDEIAKAHGGAKIVATEPLAHYLIEDAGLEDVTPAEFVEAIEEETDPPAAAVADIQNLVTQRQVQVVIHNPQTETPVVADVLSKAREANLPVVDMTETLPAGQEDYVNWMTDQIKDLSSALEQQ